MSPPKQHDVRVTCGARTWCLMHMPDDTWTMVERDDTGTRTVTERTFDSCATALEFIMLLTYLYMDIEERNGGRVYYVRRCAHTYMGVETLAVCTSRPAADAALRLLAGNAPAGAKCTGV